MKSTCIHAMCIVFATMFHCRAQEVHDVKKNRAILNKYLAAQESQDNAYFYGLYVDNYLAELSTSDSLMIRKFFHGSNQSHVQSILIARIADLTQLDNLEDTVLVYGPRAMQSIVDHYVPRPRGRYAGHQRFTLLRWWRRTLTNSVGFSPSGVAYARWFVPYSMASVESNPNALPYYMTNTNTNKYLLSSDK